MRTITITFGITAVAMFVGLAACGDDTESASGSGGSGNTGNTGNPTSTTGADTGGATSSTGGGGENAGGGGGSATELAHCGQTCVAAVDCCPPGAMGCPDMGMTQYDCTAGECAFKGCQADADCSLIPNYKCFQEGTAEYAYGACGMPCTADADCAALQMKCLADKDGDMYCKTDAPPPAGCKKDTDCIIGGAQNGVCDVASGACTCNSDADCKVPGFDHCFD